MKKLFALLITSVPALALAQIDPPNNLNDPSITRPSDVLNYTRSIGNWIFAALLAVAVIFILLAAFQYLTSKSGEEIKKAHKMIFYAAIAITMAVFAKGIIVVIAALAGKPIDPTGI